MGKKKERLVRLRGNLSMKKVTSFSTSWVQRWFNQEGDLLCYYLSQRQLEHIGFIELRSVESVESQYDEKVGGWVIEVESTQHEKRKKMNFSLLATSEQECRYWTRGILLWRTFFTREYSKIASNFEKHNNHLQHPPTNLARPLPSTTTHAAAKAAARLSVSHSPPPRPPSPSTSSHFFDEKGEEGKEEGKGELEKKREKEKEKENDRGGKRGLGKEKKKEKREDNQKGEGEEEVEALREKLQRDRQTLLRLLEETQTQQKNFRKKYFLALLREIKREFEEIHHPLQMDDDIVYEECEKAGIPTERIDSFLDHFREACLKHVTLAFPPNPSRSTSPFILSHSTTQPPIHSISSSSPLSASPSCPNPSLLSRSLSRKSSSPRSSPLPSSPSSSSPPPLFFTHQRPNSSHPPLASSPSIKFSFSPPTSSPPHIITLSSSPSPPPPSPSSPSEPPSAISFSSVISSFRSLPSSSFSSQPQPKPLPDFPAELDLLFSNGEDPPLPSPLPHSPTNSSYLSSPSLHRSTLPPSPSPSIKPSFSTPSYSPSSSALSSNTSNFNLKSLSPSHTSSPSSSPLSSPFPLASSSPPSPSPSPSVDKEAILNHLSKLEKGIKEKESEQELLLTIDLLRKSLAK